MNKEIQEDLQKKMELALNMVDINVKAMNSFVENQSKVLKDVISTTIKGSQEQLGNTGPVSNVENSIKLSTELQKKYSSLLEENMNLVKKTGEEVTNVINKSFEGYKGAAETKSTPKK